MLGEALGSWHICGGDLDRTSSIRRLQVDRRAPAHQRARDVHDHQRFDHAAGGARRDGRGGEEVCASRRAGRCRRRPAGGPHGRRMGARHQRVFCRADARERGVRRGRQPGPPRSSAEPERVCQRRSHHSHPFAQRVRRRDPVGRPARGRSLDTGRARGGARAPHRAHLRDGESTRRREPAERQGDGPDRERQGRAHSRGRGGRDPDRAERAPAERRDARRLQRRQVPSWTADRRPAARAQGSGEGRVGPQRAAPRRHPIAQGREGRRDRDADGGRDVGEARPRRRVEALDRVARSHRAAPLFNPWDHDHHRAAERLVEPHAVAENSSGTARSSAWPAMRLRAPCSTASRGSRCRGPAVRPR